MSEIADAINDTVGDLFGGPENGGTEDTAVAVAAPEAEVATPATEPAEDAWDFEAAGRDLFADDEDDAPDFDALAEAELGVTETGEDVLAPTDYDDDTTRELKKQLLKSRKEAEYHQRRHLDTARKAWEADVKKQPWGEFAPDLSTIKASSHREFIRQAKAAARTNYTVLKPHFDRLAAERQRVLEGATVEAREAATKAWGKPTIGGSQVPAAAEATGDRLGQAIRSRSMVDVVKTMIDSGQI